MAHNCKNCKFHDVDYEWYDDIDDEVKIGVCRKGHKLLLHLPFKCPHFKKYKPKPYVEQFTECDKCKYLKQCESDGYVINCTNGMDSHEHYIKGMNVYCRKESGTFDDKKLSDIIKIMEQKNDPQFEKKQESFSKSYRVVWGYNI